MAILNIIEVQSKNPHLYFNLELRENTYFNFKLKYTKLNANKLRTIVKGLNKSKIVLWKQKINKNLWYIFYYYQGSFYYQNGYEVTIIPITNDDLESIHNFIDNFEFINKNTKCILY